MTKFSPATPTVQPPALRAKLDALTAPNAIAPRDDAGPAPLSYPQQRMWILDQLGAGPAYAVAYAAELVGDLDRTALEYSLRHIMERHAILRCRLVHQAGVILQRAEAPPERILAYHDLRNTDAAAIDACLATLSSRPFDLQEGPLFRADLLQTGAGRHVLLLGAHHLVWDESSGAVFQRELALLYNGYRRAGKAGSMPLAPLTLSYADYACWQREQAGTPRWTRSLAYWTRQLSGAPDLLTLPGSLARPPQQTYRGAVIHFTVPAEIATQLRTLARAARATPFITLLALYQILLSRYSGQEDICVGCAMAGRTAECENLIGYFANTLVIRSQIDQSASFMELLMAVRQTVADGLAHQEPPFEAVIEALAVPRALSHTPLFQAAFALHDTAMDRLELDGVGLRRMELDSEGAKIDLTLNMEFAGAGIDASFEYNTDLFDHRLIESMAAHFVRLLALAVARPEAPLSSLDMLDAAERAAAVTHRPAATAGDALTFERRFALHAARTPDHPALLSRTGQVSYADLNRRANRLAAHLQSLGVGPETLVGICVEAPEHFVTAMLAVLKAGGAYLPLDPAYPFQRLARMLAHAAPPVLLTESQLLDDLPDGSAVTCCLDQMSAALAGCCEHDPAPRANMAHLAYVIFTSGSTGQPKGVLLTHGGLHNLMHAQRQAFQLAPQERVLQFASFNFDASTWEIVMALGSGASLCVASREELMPGAGLEETMTALAVTVATLPPVVLESLAPARLPHLRTLVSAGEACPPKLSAMWAERGAFFNAYGPTEATVCASMCLCAPADGTPLGEPIAGCSLYLLDRWLNPVAPGVTGQIYIGGAGVARAYLSQAATSAASFLPDPFAAAPGARMYRSGDLALRRSDGKLMFLGRSDPQLKLRGLRIEPGEIETALRAHRFVDDALVRPYQSRSGQPALAAHVLLASPEEADHAAVTASLRRHLADLLPSYMVPAAFSFTGAWPLTRSGKIDVQALVPPDELAAASEYEPPATDAERALAALWSGLLNVAGDRIGRRSVFFDIGGNSLLAMQMIAQLAHKGYRLSLADVMQHAELQAMAACTHPLETAVLETADDAGELPILPNHVQSLLNSTAAGRNRWGSVSLFQLPSGHDAGAVERALRALELQHDALRLGHVQDEDGRWRAYIFPPAERGQFQAVDLCTVGDDEYAQAFWRICDDMLDNTDTGAGPLLQMRLLDFGPSRPAQLLISINHYGTDAASNLILVEDFMRLYAQQLAGEAPHLPRSSLTYADYARGLQRYAESPECLAQLDYWTSPERASDPAIECDGAGGPISQFVSHHGQRQIANLDRFSELAAACGDDALNLGELLMAAFLRAYVLWSRKSYMHVNLIDNGRLNSGLDLDLSRTVGWLSVLYPIVLDSGGQVQELAPLMQAVARQLRRVPRDKSSGLLRYCHPDPAVRERMAGLREPQINFNYLGHSFTRHGAAPGMLGMPFPARPTAAPSVASAVDEAVSAPPHLLVFEVEAHDDRLYTNWSHSPALHRLETMMQLDRLFLDSAAAMIDVMARR